MALPYVWRFALAPLQPQFKQRSLQKIIHSFASQSRSSASRAGSGSSQKACSQFQQYFVPSRIFSRGFRAKRNEISTPKQPVSDSPSLIKPFLFTVGVCGCSFTGAMIVNYEKLRNKFQDLKKRDEAKAKKSPKDKEFGFRQHLNGMWNQFNSGQKIILGIMAANLAVWGLWRVVSLQPMMMRYFSSSISHPLSSMTLASFSHISFFHMFVNMYVLWSFSNVAVNLYGGEQFSAVYLSGGTVSSFASIALNRLLKRPSAVSVGASGAIMTLLGVVCMKYPNAELSIAFISEIFPHSFSADTGMKAIIAFDVLGLVLGWRVLDHAGHLGGMLFGILYAKYGNKLVWDNRETIMKQWHNLRGKP